MSIRFAPAYAVAAILCSGCSKAPNVAILGAYFPGWMLCALLGIALAMLLRVVAGVAGLHREEAQPLLYPVLALLCGTLLWICLFRGL